MEKEDEKLLKAKEKVAKEANKIMKKTFVSLQKELNALLKSNKFWYSGDDKIKEWPEMQKPSDRNADQAIIDLFLTSAEPLFEGMTPDMLFTKDDFDFPTNNK